MFKNVLRIFSERANALVIILTALQFSHQSLVPLDIVSLYFMVDFHMDVPPQTDRSDFARLHSIECILTRGAGF